MPQPALLWSPGGADHEARLARAAAAGSGRAFTTLYDRYERRTYNLALRITGSEEAAAEVTREAFLDALRALSQIKEGEPFGTCLLTAACNAASERADAGPPAGEEAESAEDDDDFVEWQERLRGAALRLPPQERAVLALAGMETVSYAEIAAIADADPDSVPELVADARLALHDELFDTTLASAPPEAEDCAQALPLIAMRDDGALADEDDVAWLVDHLAHCADCRVRLDAVEEASAAYLEWELVAPPPALLRQVAAAAAALAHADWDELIDEREAARAEGRTRGRTLAAMAPTAPLPALRPALTGAGDAAGEALGSLRSAASGLAADAWRRRPRANNLATAGLLAVVLLGLTAIAAGATLILRGDDDGSPDVSPVAPADSATDPPSGATFPTGPEPRPTERTAGTERRRKKRPKPVVVRTAPRPETTTTETPAPRRRSVPQVVAVPVPRTRTTPTPPAEQPPPTTPPAQTTPELPQFKPDQ